MMTYLLLHILDIAGVHFTFAHVVPHIRQHKCVSWFMHEDCICGGCGLVVFLVLYDANEKKTRKENKVKICFPLKCLKFTFHSTETKASHVALTHLTERTAQSTVAGDRLTFEPFQRQRWIIIGQVTVNARGGLKLSKRRISATWKARAVTCHV